MVKLIAITSHPSLVQEIIGEFAFMKLMSLPDDRSYEALQAVDLNDVYKKAADYLLSLFS